MSDTLLDPALDLLVSGARLTVVRNAPADAADRARHPAGRGRPRTTPVVRAVIPTAFAPELLPATKAVPLELLPMAGVPTIERIVASAAAVGLTDVLLVTAGASRAIEDHFDRDVELERRLFDRDDRVGQAAIHDRARHATIHAVRQRAARGLGDQVVAARHHVGSDPFVVLAADRLVTQDERLLRALIATHHRSGLGVVALPPSLATIDATPEDFERYGRYLFTGAVFDALAEIEPDGHGERRLGDAVALLVGRGELVVIPFASDRCDLRDRLDRLRTELALLLDDPPIRRGVEQVLADTLDLHEIGSERVSQETLR